MKLFCQIRSCSVVLLDRSASYARCFSLRTTTPAAFAQGLCSVDRMSSQIEILVSVSRVGNSCQQCSLLYVSRCTMKNSASRPGRDILSIAAYKSIRYVLCCLIRTVYIFCVRYRSFLPGLVAKFPTYLFGSSKHSYYYFRIESQLQQTKHSKCEMSVTPCSNISSLCHIVTLDERSVGGDGFENAVRRGVRCQTLRPLCHVV